MNSRRPRTLRFYWNYPGDDGVRSAWRGFITKWVRRHDNWELSELHWFSYVEEFMACQEFELHSGARLTRKAEGAAQHLLTVIMAGHATCKYCVA